MSRPDYPSMPSCNGCGDCCGPVNARPKEIARIKQFIDDNAIGWLPPDDSDPLKCGFLRPEDGRYTCAIYPVRPWACRVFGIIASMSCKHFPEDAATITDITADESVSKGYGSPWDRMLGEVFEKRFVARLRGLAHRPAVAHVLEMLAVREANR